VPTEAKTRCRTRGLLHAEANHARSIYSSTPKPFCYRGFGEKRNVQQHQWLCRKRKGRRLLANHAPLSTRCTDIKCAGHKATSGSLPLLAGQNCDRTGQTCSPTPNELAMMLTDAHERRSAHRSGLNFVAPCVTLCTKPLRVKPSEHPDMRDVHTGNNRLPEYHQTRSKSPGKTEYPYKHATGTPSQCVNTTQGHAAS
jgi:hypothetical protein